MNGVGVSLFLPHFPYQAEYLDVVVWLGKVPLKFCNKIIIER
jgi:hypothetical protein